MTIHSGILAVIPARGGSKGIPNKNVRPLCGKPLIAYTIEAALRSCRLTRIVTTTDNDEIARVAESCGSEVIKRPGRIAQDDSPVSLAAVHVLDELASRNEYYEYLVLLQPTCPLRSESDIDGAVSLLVESGGDAVVTVYRVEDQHPARMYAVTNNRLVPYDSRLEQLHRQDLPPLYHRNGAVYAITSKALRAHGTFFPPDKLAYVMPRIRSVNIDEEADFMLAEFLVARQASFV